jgi:ABC-type sugar transport system ATPase subunit
LEKIDKEKLLEVKRLYFSYGDKPILKNLSFELRTGEILAIIGESGSGKTSLLKLLAGLLSPNRGEIFYKGNVVQGPNEKLIPGHESIKLVNQDFDLMPYLSVSDNILRDNLGLSDRARKKTLGYYQKSLKLNTVKTQQAAKTSGGQKQRVALATALASRPAVLLLDEPFSNMDFPLKQSIINRIQSDWKANGTILIAHEPSDVLSLANRILVLKDGRIEQEGNTQQLYQNPKNRYVAELLGSINHIKQEEAYLLDLETDEDLWIRPDRFIISDQGLTLKKTALEFYGAFKILKGKCEGISNEILIQLASYEEVGDEVKVGLRQ